MASSVAVRKPCVRCDETIHTPSKFLIQCCRCQRAWHHPCHIPPISEAEILQRIEADEDGRPAGGLGSWVCRRCSKQQKAYTRELAAVSPDITTSGKISLSSPGLVPETKSLQQEVHTQTGSQASKTRERVPPIPPVSKPYVGQTSQVESPARATPRIDLLHPPPQKRATKVATGHRQHGEALQEPLSAANSTEALPKWVMPTALSSDTTANKRPTSTHGSHSMSSTATTASFSVVSSPPPSSSPKDVSSPSHSPQDPFSTSAPQYGDMLPTSPSLSAATLVAIPDIAPSPTLLRPSSPRIPWTMKGKERMPDFPAMLSDLRAAGKLQGPPILEQVLQCQQDTELGSDREMTPRLHVSDESARGGTHEIDERCDMPPPEPLRSRSRYDTHDIEDMYATPAPRPAPPIASIASLRAEGTHTFRHSSVAESLGTRLVFEWQNERYVDGEGDEIFAMLGHRIRRIEQYKKGVEPRKPRKVATQRLSKSDRRRRESEVLHFLYEAA